MGFTIRTVNVIFCPQILDLSKEKLPLIKKTRIYMEETSGRTTQEGSLSSLLSYLTLSLYVSRIPQRFNPTLAASKKNTWISRRLSDNRLVVLSSAAKVKVEPCQNQKPSKHLQPSVCIHESNDRSSCDAESEVDAHLRTVTVRKKGNDTRGSHFFSPEINH